MKVGLSLHACVPLSLPRAGPRVCTGAPTGQVRECVSEAAPSGWPMDVPPHPTPRSLGASPCSPTTVHALILPAVLRVEPGKLQSHEPWCKPEWTNASGWSLAGDQAWPRPSCVRWGENHAWCSQPPDGAVARWQLRLPPFPPLGLPICTGGIGALGGQLCSPQYT